MLRRWLSAQRNLADCPLVLSQVAYERRAIPPYSLHSAMRWWVCWHRSLLREYAGANSLSFLDRVPRISHLASLWCSIWFRAGCWLHGGRSCVRRRFGLQSKAWMLAGMRTLALKGLLYKWNSRFFGITIFSLSFLFASYNRTTLMLLPFLTEPSDWEFSTIR